jgi:hypothetical protein
MTGRPLTRRERGALKFTIMHGIDTPITDPPSDDDRATWLNSVDALRVHEMCRCGECPSIVFTDDWSEDIPTFVALQVVSSQWQILLTIRGDRPSSLDLTTYGEDSKSEFPTLHQLRHTD